jgi:L-ribulose-5-phosphate 4-epimerase
MENLKESVYKANIYLWKNNLVYGTQGNVSGIDRNNGSVVIKPSGVPYENLQKDALPVVDLEGNIKEGKLKPSVDSVHHLFLYKNINEIGGVCHTHSRFITVFSVLKIPVPVLTTAHADVFGKEIPVTRYVDNTGDNIGRTFIESYERNRCPAIILGNHGLFTVGETPEKSAFYALMAEYCAEVSFYSLISGKLLDKKIEPLSLTEIKKWYNRYHSDRYGQKK